MIRYYQPVGSLFLLKKKSFGFILLCAQITYIYKHNDNKLISSLYVNLQKEEETEVKEDEPEAENEVSKSL